MSTSSGSSSPPSPHTHSLAQIGPNSYLARRKLCQTVMRSCLPRRGVGCNHSLPWGQRVRCSATVPRHVSAKATPSSIKHAISKFQQPSYRWFAFDTETTGLSIRDDCVIQLAAYDVESGNAYTTLVNPAYHRPKYKFGQEAAKKHGNPIQFIEADCKGHTVCQSTINGCGIGILLDTANAASLPGIMVPLYAGIQQLLVESEGIPLQQAMAELVGFVVNNTPPGQIPALAAHYGYKFHYPIMHNNLQAAAAAAPACKPLSSTGSTAGRRRQRKTVSSQVPAASAGGRSRKLSKHSATVAQQVFDSWPSNWMFHDTYLMASSIDKIDRTVPGVSPLSTKLTRENLVQSLLPPSYSEADVQPHERAFAHAVSVARLLPLLLAMINNPPELDVPGNGDTRGGSRHQALSDKSFMLAQRGLLYRLHRRWLSRPWPLNYRSRTSKGFLIPQGAVQAIQQHRHHEGCVDIRYDPLADIVEEYW